MSFIKKSTRQCLKVILLFALFCIAASGCGNHKKDDEPESPGDSIQAGNSGELFTKEDENTFLAVQEAFLEVGASYNNGDGFVETSQIPYLMNELIKAAQKELLKGTISSYSKGDNSIYVEFPNGLSCIYTIPVEGTWSGNLSNGAEIDITDSYLTTPTNHAGSVVGYQPQKSSLGVSFWNELENLFQEDMSIEESCSRVRSFYGNAIYAELNYTDENVNFDSFASMEDSNVIIWEGHGVYANEEIHSVLVTGMQYKFYQNAEIDNLLSSKTLLLTTNLLNQTSPHSELCITAEYVRQYINVRENAIVYLGACSSAADNELAAAFLEKGAAVVIGYSQKVRQAYEIEAQHHIFTYLASGHSVSDSVAYARKICGNTDQQGTELRIIGIDSYSLSSYEDIFCEGCFHTGHGTEDDPYLVENWMVLQEMCRISQKGVTFNGVSIALKNDIVMSAEQFDGIMRFEGNFDGRGFSISGLTISNDEQETSEGKGLFILTSDARISNLTIKNSSVTGVGIDGTGAIAGAAFNTVFENCHNYANVSGTQANVGGIVGSGSSVTIANCSNHGTITAGFYKIDYRGAGGIAGSAISSTISNCINYGTVSIDETITANYNQCVVGGIAGHAAGGIITGCRNEGHIVDTASYGGGIVGHSGVSIDPTNTDFLIIENCENHGTVEGGSIGGIAGYCRGVHIIGCLNAGTMLSRAYDLPIAQVSCGGIVYFIEKGSVMNCSYTGNSILTKTGASFVPKLVCSSNAELTNENELPETQNQETEEESTDHENNSEESANETTAASNMSITVSGFADWTISLNDAEDGWIYLPAISVRFDESITSEEAKELLNHAMLWSENEDVLAVKNVSHTTFGNSAFITAALTVKKAGTSKITLSIGGNRYTVNITITE